MQCPKCQSNELKPQDLLGNIEVDHCAKCNGMYFEKGEMGAYLHFSKDLPNYKDLLKEAKPSCTCPECQGQMKELKYVPDKELFVDYCENCGGVWLDGGEVDDAQEIAGAQEQTKVRLLRAIWEMRVAVRGEDLLVCPKCKKPTVTGFTSGEGVTVDMCDKCNGTWFEKGEIASYFELSQDIPNKQEALATAKETGLKCPRCRKVGLLELEYCQQELKSGKLIVDYCPTCEGLWLDKGEMLSLECLSVSLESPGARLGRAYKELMDKGYVSM